MSLFARPAPCRCGEQTLPAGIKALTDKYGDLHSTIGGCQVVREIRVVPEDAPLNEWPKYFIARDRFEPCLWRETDTGPICLVRRSEVTEEVWRLIGSHPDTQSGGTFCDNCGRFVIDDDPTDVDHMAELTRHRNAECQS